MGHFPPAQILSGLISSDLQAGFLIINPGILIAGLYCWFFFIRHIHAISSGLIWCWIILEMINGIGHPDRALYIGKYTPGLITAPILLLLAIYLGRLLLIRIP